MAASADSAASTMISWRSRMRDRNARADFESSTTKARLEGISSPLTHNRFEESLASTDAQCARDPDFFQEGVEVFPKSVNFFDCSGAAFHSSFERGWAELARTRS